MPGFGPGIEQGAIGEGFGDFFAAMYYLDHGDATYQSTRRYCIGDWDAASYNPFNAAPATAAAACAGSTAPTSSTAATSAPTRGPRARSTTTGVTGRRR